MTITDQPDVAWLFNLGREGQVYVDPYTGAITGEGNKSVRGAMTELRNWHRYVAMSGDQRPIGKAITGAQPALSFLAFRVSTSGSREIWCGRRSSPCYGSRPA